MSDVYIVANANNDAYEEVVGVFGSRVLADEFVEDQGPLNLELGRRYEVTTWRLNDAHWIPPEWRDHHDVTRRLGLR